MLKIIRALGEEQSAIVQDDKSRRYFSFSTKDMLGEYYAASRCNKKGVIYPSSTMYAVAPVLWKKHKDKHNEEADVLCYEFGRNTIYAFAEIKGQADGVMYDDHIDFTSISRSDIYDNEEELDDFKNEFYGKGISGVNIFWSFFYEQDGKKTLIGGSGYDVCISPDLDFLFKHLK